MRTIRYRNKLCEQNAIFPYQLGGTYSRPKHFTWKGEFGCSYALLSSLWAFRDINLYYVPATDAIK
jgi:hypothetical protein